MKYNKDQFDKPVMNAYERRQHNSRAMAQMLYKQSYEQFEQEEKKKDKSWSEMDRPVNKVRPAWLESDQKFEEGLWDE